MKTHVGRMEAFDALLEARFNASFRPEARSEHLEDEAERGTLEPGTGGGKDPLPAVPPPAGGGSPHGRRALL